MIDRDNSAKTFRLRPIGKQGWQFENEQVLEAFVWHNLETLFGLKGLAQQYRVENQICDIVAVSPSGQLVVLELKNVEDRYVVPQLVRYYDALFRNQSLVEQVDYGQPVRLYAIAPNFHSDNFTDQKYCKLNINFFSFNLVSSYNNKINCAFHLKNLTTQEVSVSKVSIDPQNTQLPSPISTFERIRKQCPETEQAGLIWIRERLLSAHPEMKAVREGSAVIYQKSKTKPCAELRFDPQRSCAALFLHLPYPQGHGIKSIHSHKYGCYRIRVWTDWKTVHAVGRTHAGLGRKVSELELREGTMLASKKFTKEIARAAGYSYSCEHFERKWPDLKWRNKLLDRMQKKKTDFPFADHGPRASGAMKFKHYSKAMGKPELDDSLSTLVDIAIQTWLERL